MRAIRSKATFPNTLLTDKSPSVWHTVDYEGKKGKGTAYVQAHDPYHALTMVNEMTEEEAEKHAIKPEAQPINY